MGLLSPGSMAKNVNLKDVLNIIYLSRIETTILPKVWLTVRRPI